MSDRAKTELPKSYTPVDAEGEIRARWEQARAFHAAAAPASEAPPYCILIPPPNVTAALHLGHAFNNTIQDILIRYHRMRGFNTLWMPGTDHAGIATQAVVEKRLMQTEGRKRTDYSRGEFIAKVQAWKDEYEATIIEQLKAMGASCDFERTRFTMDEVCAKAVREAFFRLFRDGLIYRGKRLVNWDPVTQTALADDEVEMEEVAGKMCYLRYPVVETSKRPNVQTSKELVTVATTRPETMLGDTAVAINPRDPRAPQFRGQFVKLPIVGRVIPIIEDDYVVMPDTDDPKAAFATGFLKVTPAHDPNDWEIGLRHNLPVINVMAPDASISDSHGWDDVGDEARPLVGLAREEARKKVIEWFKSHNLYEGEREYVHSVGHSYRSHVPIEPYLSDQWYVRVTDDRMKGEALRAMAADQRAGAPPMREHIAPGLPGVDAESPTSGSRTPTPAKAGAKWPAREGDGELRFFPERYAKTFQQWHENLRDWCISRQLWWGHRIPVWSAPCAARCSSRDTQSARTIASEFLEAMRVPVDEVAIRIDAEPSAPRFSICARTEEVRVLIDAVNAALAAPEEEDERWMAGGDFTWREREFAARGLKEVARNTVAFERAYELSYFLDDPLVQDPDVLDTWFSSGLWPLSTMGWPAPGSFPNEIPEADALLETFNPSSVLCTAREIITLWVSRMVMFNRYFRAGKLPFRHVYIHAMIQDGHGQKMSKSLGNGVDPRDIIHAHGADAMRFTLAKLATATQDVRMPVDVVCPHCETAFGPEEITTSGGAGHRVAAPELSCPKCGKRMVSGYGAASGRAQPTSGTPLARNSSRKFDEGRNFANKLWNAARFALSNLSDQSPGGEAQGLQSLGLDAREFALADRWMLARIHRTLSAVETTVAEYQFHIYADAMYDLVWREFCDWYLEAIKPTVRDDPHQQAVLASALDAILRMLHPIMPFVTEAIWENVSATARNRKRVAGAELPPSDLCATAAWPRFDSSLDDPDAIAAFGRVQAVVESVRTIRGERNVPRKKLLRLAVGSEVMALIESSEAGEIIRTLAGLEAIEPLERFEAAQKAGGAPFAAEGGEMLLIGLVERADESDIEAERSRLTKFISEKERAIFGFRSRLENANYVSKAPPDRVEETRRLLAEAEADRDTARRALESLEIAAGRTG